MSEDYHSLLGQMNSRGGPDSQNVSVQDSCREERQVNSQRTSEDLSFCALTRSIHLSWEHVRPATLASSRCQCLLKPNLWTHSGTGSRFPTGETIKTNAVICHEEPVSWPIHTCGSLRVHMNVVVYT